MEICIKVISFVTACIMTVAGFAAAAVRKETIEEVTEQSTTEIVEVITSEANTEVTSHITTTTTEVETDTSSTAKSTTALTTIPQTSRSTSMKNSKYLGKFKLTAYCPCTRCCGKCDGITATGVIAKPNHTIAVDPSIIPYSTHVLINGREYVAEDCGGDINGNHIDVYFSSHQEACAFGVQYAEVYLVVD